MLPVPAYIVLDFLQWVVGKHPEVSNLGAANQDTRLNLAREFQKHRGVEFYEEEWRQTFAKLDNWKGNDDYSPARNKFDPLLRYRTVPLHAIFLYTSQDPAVKGYISTHWQALHNQSADVCDIHISDRQLRNKEDAYTLMRDLSLPEKAVCPAYSELPGMYFWNTDGEFAFVPFGQNAGEAAITKTLRHIFDRINQRPEIQAVREATEELIDGGGEEQPREHSVDFFVRLVGVLPKLKTQIQLAGLIIIVVGFVATRALRPENVPAQIAGGAIGIVILLFAHVPAILKVIPTTERAKTLLGLFLLACSLIVLLALISAFAPVRSLADKTKATKVRNAASSNPTQLDGSGEGFHPLKASNGDSNAKDPVSANSTKRNDTATPTGKVQAGRDAQVSTGNGQNFRIEGDNNRIDIAAGNKAASRPD